MLAAGISLPTTGQAASKTLCRGYPIKDGAVTSMIVKGTSCSTGRGIVQRLYRGENDGYRGNVVLVRGWECRSSTGVTTCWAGPRIISAKYVLY